VISNYVKYLVDNQVDGVYVIGTTGEGYNLTNDEKLSIAKAWRKAIDEQNANLLTVINVTSTCLKEALQLSKQVESLGYDAIAVLPPNYYKPNSVDDLVNYLKLFGKAAPNTPLLYYHIPLMVGQLNFDVIKLVEEGLRQIPQFAAMKFTDDNVVRFSILQKNFKNNFKIFCGFDEVLLTALTSVECNAAVCALFNFPKVVDSYKKIISSVEKLDLENARKEQNKIIDECLKQRTSGNFFLSIKTTFNSNVKSLNLNVGYPRPPISYNYQF